jgi:hypothetical protein
MCKYSFGNGRCASIDVNFNFCIGEGNCFVSDILKNRNIKDDLKADDWQLISSKLWCMGKRTDEIK